MTRPLKRWLYRHRENPYPSKVEKQELVRASQMSLMQVNNWFANARRRLKNVVQGEDISWARRIQAYNTFAEGNAELFSIPSSDEGEEVQMITDETESDPTPPTPESDCVHNQLSHSDKLLYTNEPGVSSEPNDLSSSSNSNTQQHRPPSKSCENIASYAHDNSKPNTKRYRPTNSSYGNISSYARDNSDPLHDATGTMLVEEDDNYKALEETSSTGSSYSIGLVQGNLGETRSTTPSPAPTLTSFSFSHSGCDVTSSANQGSSLFPPPASPISGSGAMTGSNSIGVSGPCHKYKHSMMQRYLHDASQQTSLPGDLDLSNTRFRHRHLSSSTGSHDFEYLSTSSVSSPSHEPQEPQHDALDDFSEEFESIAIRRRYSEHVSTTNNDDIYWKEIGAALALTTLARSSVNKT